MGSLHEHALHAGELSGGRMSVAAAGHVQTTSISRLADGVALRTGAWVVIERLGTVVTHGAGGAPCPAPVADALLAKTTRPLRDVVTWSRGGTRLRGVVGGTSVTAVDLGGGCAAWFVGGEVEESTLPLLATAISERDEPVNDPFVAALLHPRGPARSRMAPDAQLMVLLPRTGAATALAHAVVGITSGTDARVHTESAFVVVAFPGEAEVRQVAELVAARCPGSVAGVTRVPHGAADWVTAARLAHAAARCAARLDLPLGDVQDPRIAAELVIDEAQESVAALAGALPTTPLRRLQEHDARTSSQLVKTVTSWCQVGFDTGLAAATLHVHPNTLRYRLRRAAEITGLDLNQSRQVLALQLLLAAT